MTRLWLACLWCGAALAAAKGFPAEDETLRYAVKATGGVSIGTVTFVAQRVKGTQATWNFQLLSDFSLPGVPVRDRFRSLSAGFCSAEFEKDWVHLNRKGGEFVVFYPDRRRAVRTTRNGGSSEMAVPPCARDALTMLYAVRAELAKDKLPAASPVVFGAQYQVQLNQTGSQKVRVGGKEQKGDRVAGSYRGPKSGGTFELVFARDEARTPLLMRVPLAAVTLTLELQP
ncbi:MAG: DUF3108 domain-containing protein [Bryobacteraceae bacterium]